MYNKKILGFDWLSAMQMKLVTKVQEPGELSNEYTWANHIKRAFSV